MATEMNQALGYLKDASSTLSNATNTSKSITDSIDLSQTMAFKIDQYLKDLDFEKTAQSLQLRTYFDNIIQRDINNNVRYETLMDNTNRFKSNYDLSVAKFNYDQQLNQQNFDFNQQKYNDAKDYRDKVFEWNKQVYNQQLQAQKDTLAQKQQEQLEKQQEQQQIHANLNNLYDQKQKLEVAMQQAKDKGDTTTYAKLASTYNRIQQDILNLKGKVKSYTPISKPSAKNTKNTLTTDVIKQGIATGAINRNNILEYLRQNPDSFKTLLKAGYKFNNDKYIRDIVNSHFNKEIGDSTINKETQKYVDSVIKNMSGDVKGLATGSSFFGSWANILTGAKMFDYSKRGKKEIAIKNNLYKAFENDIRNRNTIGNTPASYYAIKEFAKDPRSFGFHENAYFEEPYILRDNIYNAVKEFDTSLKLDKAIPLNENVPMSRFKKYMKSSKDFVEYSKRAYAGYISYLKGQSKDGMVSIIDKNNNHKLVPVEKIKPLVGAYMYYKYFN